MAQQKEKCIPLRKAHSYPMIGQRKLMTRLANFEFEEDSKHVKILYVADDASTYSWTSTSRSQISLGDHPCVDLMDRDAAATSGFSIKLCFTDHLDEDARDADAWGALWADEFSRRVVLLCHNEEQLIVLGSVLHPTIENLVLPAWVDVRRLRAHTSYGGERISSAVFQLVFVEDPSSSLEWVLCEAGDPLPENILPVGRNQKARLYIGRAQWNGDWYFGWVCEDYADCFVFLQGYERSFTTYQVLCYGD